MNNCESVSSNTVCGHDRSRTQFFEPKRDKTVCGADVETIHPPNIDPPQEVDNGKQRLILRLAGRKTPACDDASEIKGVEPAMPLHLLELGV
jgi:hypothetical protein